MEIQYDPQPSAGDSLSRSPHSGCSSSGGTDGFTVYSEAGRDFRPKRKMPRAVETVSLLHHLLKNHLWGEWSCQRSS